MDISINIQKVLGILVEVLKLNYKCEHQMRSQVLCYFTFPFCNILVLYNHSRISSW